MDQLPYLPQAEKNAIVYGPALAPPPGVTADFENPPNNNGLAVGVLAACVAVSSLCLLLRVYVQGVLARRFYPEDCMSNILLVLGIERWLTLNLHSFDWLWIC